MQRIGAATVRLGFLEIWQDLRPCPAVASGRGPGVVVGRKAADIDETVDGPCPAERLAARENQRAAMQLALRLGAIAPIRGGIADDPTDPHRHVDHWVTIRAAGLE